MRLLPLIATLLSLLPFLVGCQHAQLSSSDKPITLQINHFLSETNGQLERIAVKAIQLPYGKQNSDFKEFPIILYELPGGKLLALRTGANWSIIHYLCICLAPRKGTTQQEWIYLDRLDLAPDGKVLQMTKSTGYDWLVPALEN